MPRFFFMALVGALMLPALADDVDQYVQYVGVGSFNNGLFGDYQIGNKYGNIELRAGQFRQMGGGWNFNMSVRRYIEQDANVDGFYVGAYGGQVDVIQVGSDLVRRTGVGFEMGYQWVSPYVKEELFGGLGIDRQESQGTSAVQATPSFLVGVSVYLDLHPKRAGKSS